MDLLKNGRLLRQLRREKGLTQQELAQRIGVVSKTVSKWETGKGFPDVSILPALSDVFNVSERSLLDGCLSENTVRAVSLNRIKFYICPYCGSILQGFGEQQVSCCGKRLTPLKKKSDEMHSLKISVVENDLYIEFNHDMTKEHYIRFVCYIGYDRVLFLPLYPEQDCSVRIPRAYHGKIVYCCNQHGLFEYNVKNNI